MLINDKTNEDIVEINDFVIDSDDSEVNSNETSFLVDEDGNSIDIDNSLLGEYLTALKENSDTSLTEIAMNKADENSDEALKFAAVIGMDLGTGRSSTLEKSVGNMLLVKQHETVSVNEYGEEVEIEIPTEFDEIELQRYKDILSNMFVYKRSDMTSKELKDKVLQAQEIMRTHMSLVKKRNEIQKLGTQVSSNITYYEKIYAILKKGAVKQKFTEAELKELREYEGDLLKVPIKLRGLKESYNNLLLQHNKVIEQLNLYKEMEANVTKEIAEIKNKMNDLKPTVDISMKVEEVINNHSKVVAVEFGTDMYSKEFKESPIAVKCACGHVNISNLDYMPRYRSGDIIKYLKERTKINPNVKENYFNNKSAVKSRELRHELIREKNALEKRIIIPGITNDSHEPLKCEKCNKLLLFPPKVLDSLTERSFMHEKLTVELVASHKLKDIDENGMFLTLFLSKLDVESEYLKNLGLEEYRLSKLSKNPSISSDALTDDSKREGTKLSEQALRQYRNINYGTFDYEVVQNELTGHIRNINLALDSLLKEFRIPKAKNSIKKRMSEKELEKLSYKTKKNEAVSSFIVNYRYLIVLYAINKGMSSQSISHTIKTNADNIKELKRTLFEFFVDYVIDSVIEGKSLLEVGRGHITSVDLTKTTLPHANFFKCYKTLVRRYFLYGSVSKIKKDVELKEYYRQFKKLSEINLTVDYKEQLRQSEIFVKELRERMEEFYNQQDGQAFNELKRNLFMKYINDPIELENNYDELGRSQAWLYFEMKCNGVELQNTQLIDADLFAELYNDKLRQLATNNNN